MNTHAASSQQTAAARAWLRARAAWLSAPEQRWKPIPIPISARPQRP